MENSKVQKLEREVDYYKKSNENKDKTINIMEGTLTKLKSIVKSQGGRLERNRKEEMSSENIILKWGKTVKLDEAKQEIEVKTNRIKAQKETIDKLRRKSADLKEENDEYRKREQTLEETVEELTKENDRLKKENEEYRRKENVQFVENINKIKRRRVEMKRRYEEEDELLKREMDIEMGFAKKPIVGRF